MAIVLKDEYANTNPADADYPQGSIKNSTSPATTDGTPVDELWGNDQQGLLQAILLEAGLTPSGVPDTARASQYLAGLKSIMGLGAGSIRGVSADSTALTTDVIIEIDGSANTVDVTLLSAVAVGARAIILQRKFTDDGTFAVNVLADGVELLGGQASVPLIPGETVKFVPKDATGYLQL